jgi:hypothetical protein
VLIVRSEPGSGTQLVAQWPLGPNSPTSSALAAGIVGTRRDPSLDPAAYPDDLRVGRS